MLIGLDPSTTKFGVAFGASTDGAPRSLVWKLPGAGDDAFDRTLLHASSSLAELCALIKATDVFIEAPIIISDRSAHTMVALMQLTGAMRATALRAGCRVELIASSTVRVHFLGRGRREDPKRAVQDMCRVLNWKVSDDNAADACAVWAFGMSKRFPKWSPKSTPLFGRAAAEAGAAG